MDLKLDYLSSNGDLAIENGTLALIKEADAIRQHVTQRLGIFFGEWFLDQEAGVPYYQVILVKSPNLPLVDAVLKDAVLSTPGVQEMIEFEMDFEPETRALTLDFKVRTLNGEVDFGSLVLGGTGGVT